MIKRALLICIVALLFHSCGKNDQNSIFKILDASDTGIDFSNTLINTTEFNILSYLYFYNGGGVAVGDINNDDLPDIYLCGNQVEDKLFLNLGDFKFKDVSDYLPGQNVKGWSTGVTMVDINHDGFLDIYVSRLGDFESLKDANKLFINKNGNSFIDESANYGLDFSGLCTQSVFFDYDRDGDLDCYLLNHSIKDPSQFKPSNIRTINDSISGDRLLENIKGYFVDVTKQANIFSSNIGFGLGIDISDVNNDGWLDIYVGNDFHEQDYLYLNQGDKTFKESIELSTGHTSNFSMGCAIADLNNDLSPDIVTMDMKPPSYVDYKKSGGWESMQIYNYKRSFGYHHQSPKNSFQINLGNQNGVPQFSEQSSFYKTSSTDWSWSPMIYDFDNDGDKDIFITNGIEYRPNDLDFIKFHFSNSKDLNLSKLDLMPSGLAHNCYFSNDIQKGLYNETLIGPKNATTGAAVADLNLDGKLDIVINEVNGTSKILKNTSISKLDYLQIKLLEPGKNINGLGSSVIVYQDGLVQLSEIKSSNGFQSCGVDLAHFAISNLPIDSIQVLWADGSRQLIIDTDAYRNKRVTISKQNSSERLNLADNKKSIQSIPGFETKLSSTNNQVSEKWLLYDPHCSNDLMFPIDDESCFIINDDNQELYQLHYGSKTLERVEIPELNQNVKFLNAGITNIGQFFILTQTKLLNSQKTNTFRTELHLLDKNFELLYSKSLNLSNDLSRSKILIGDFDNDLDLDVVVGGSYLKGKYGSSSKTVLYRNNNFNFENVELLVDDLVYDMKFVNLDQDKELELIVVGHWFPITIFDSLEGNPQKTEILNSSGLWFCIDVDDFDNDGQLELFAGNFGLNHDLNVGIENPLKLYFNDFDKNGQFESLITMMVDGKEVPYFGHETFIEQLPIIKRDFIKATDFANAGISDIIEPSKLQTSKTKKLQELRSSFYKLNEGSWTRKDVSQELYKFPITKISINNSLIFLSGNIDEVDPNLGRQDAGQILVLNKKNKKIMNSQFNIPIDRSMILGSMVTDSLFYYLPKNDKLKYFNFK